MTLRQQAIDRSATSGSRTGEVGPRTPTGARTRITAVRELVLLVILYAGYTSARLLASNDRDRATRRAAELATIEHRLRLNWEHPAITLATAHPWLGVAASYWYSTAHYLLTPVVLVWLYRRHPSRFGRARTALALATFAGLAIYLLLPTAPPRLLPGYSDVLALHAHAGWWGADASAPRGLGGLTNELAALPSLHAGWSLWVALAIHTCARGLRVRALAWTQTLLTAAVVVLTGNHWVIDVLAGWGVILTGWLLASLAYLVPNTPHEATGDTRLALGQTIDNQRRLHPAARLEMQLPLTRPRKPGGIPRLVSTRSRPPPQGVEASTGQRTDLGAGPPHSLL